VRSLLVIAIGATLVGCLEAPAVSGAGDAGLGSSVPPDAGAPAPLTLRDWAVRGHGGAPWPTEAVPERPIIELWWSVEPAVDEDDAPPVWLLEGPMDPSLLEDLQTAPLRAANRDRIIEATLDRDGAVWRLIPTARVDRDSTLTLAIGAWLRAKATGRPLGEPRVEALRVSTAPEAGARVTASWPPDAAATVSPALDEIALRLDGPFSGHGFALFEGEREEAVDAAPADCPALGWADGWCARLVPRRPLRRGSEHRIVVDTALVDGSGAPIGPWEARFRTTPDDRVTPPSPATPACALDELPTPLGCALVDDDSVALRVELGVPARVEWIVGEARALTVASRGAATLRVGDLPPERAFETRLRATGTDGAPHEWTVELSTTAPLARVAIVEVRADPRGPEPAQEYVEVLNYGDVPISLDGFALSDRADSEGDLLAGALAAGERALIVSSRFDPEDPADPPVPPGVRLIRVDAALGSGGLTNAGEPLFLRDAEGRRLSAAPALSADGPGRCLVNEGPDPRRPDGFVRAECTPGVP